MKLRPYQLEQVNGVMKSWENGNRAIMMQLPTGGGKTVIAAEIAQRWRKERRGGLITVLTHRRELVRQTTRAFSDYGLPRDAVNAITPRQDAAKVAVLESGENDLLIVDEAHHSPATTWESVITDWNGGVLGLTATPWRMSTTEGFDHIYDALICGPQPAELRDDGFLAPVQVLEAKHKIKGKGKNATGDFSVAETMRANSVEVLIDLAIDELERHDLTQERVIAYCVGVEHARSLAEVARKRGIPAGVVLGQKHQPKRERDQTIDEFERGELRLIANVEVATEGFDLPEASVCLMLRPTKSTSLYLQMIGRVRRPMKDKVAVLIDAAENYKEHGLPDEYREWSLAPRPPGEGKQPMKKCRGCQSIDYIATHICAACGYHYGRKCAAAPYGCGEWRTWEKGWNPSTSTMRCLLCVENETAQETKRLGTEILAIRVADEMLEKVKNHRYELIGQDGEIERQANEIERLKSENLALVSTHPDLVAENEKLRRRIAQLEKSEAIAHVCPECGKWKKAIFPRCYNCQEKFWEAREGQ